MTPFQEFRDWARRGPTEERLLAFVAAVLAAALVAWLAVPDGGRATAIATGDTGGLTSTRPAGTATTLTPGTPTSEPAPTSGSTSAAVNGATGSVAAKAGPSGTASGCVAPPGSDTGVTASTIKIAVTLVNLAAGATNDAFGLPSTEDQQRDYQLVADAINAGGGVACRKLVLQFFKGNPLDQSDLQQKCLDVIEAGAFAVVDAGAYYTNPAIATCFPTNRIPFLSAGPQPNSALERFYPYLFAKASVDTIYRNTVFALRDRGFFDPAKGMQKLGFVHRSCTPPIVQAYKGWLRDAGVPDARLVTYDVGCPSGSGFTSPATLAQAVLKFQQSGVTHVTHANFGADFSTFTKIAQQQRFNPKYGFGDEGIVAITYSNTRPDYANLADAIAITPDQYGQERTPGLPASPRTAECDRIYTAHGVPDGAHGRQGFNGAVCNQLWLITAAIGHAPSLQRASVAAGMNATKSLEVSYPFGPNDFSGNRVTTGGQFWRPLQFLAACSCWRVIDPAFRRSY
jgi:hypothetical protein